ncbi:hypothetical protein PV10_08704 [Exophiala mesophila]|uniref:GH16 domain-containing protein n=1 Tax=Exophiala mesophila TaxID=212818 RepID=A0A0D1WJQ6_EXOME|nr:uncharacterized protein PV10_08704 [Exophiala mesophila]KIV89100.1 hypothetical protein PV10_08704 [Exophiala mesophila]
MHRTRIRTLWALLAVYSQLTPTSATDSGCNPLREACPPVPGLASTSYSIDFTKQSSTPAEWTLADHATVDYAANDGATFTFRKRYDAPYIWTNFYFLYGKVEVVLKAAPGIGIITGAVLMADDGDEVDWEWSGNNFGNKTGKVQTNFFGKGITGNYGRGTEELVDSPQSKFHTYSYDWTPEALSWSIDGRVVRILRNNGTTTGDWQYPQTPSRLHLGVWCAGDPDAYAGTVFWAGGYTKFEDAPFSAYVKSVKITTPNACKSWKYPSSFDGSWRSVQCSNDAIYIPCNYTVAAGDDGYKIAKTLKVNFETLQAANPDVVDWKSIWVGYVLKVPGGDCSSVAAPSQTNTSDTANPSTTTTTSTDISSSTAAEPSSNSPIVNSTSTSESTAPTQSPLYEVVSGDRFDIIAQRLNCSSAALHEANPNVDWGKLQIGQHLNIPAQPSTPPTSVNSTATDANATAISYTNSTTSLPTTSAQTNLSTETTTQSMTTTTKPPDSSNATVDNSTSQHTSISLTFAFNSSIWSNTSTATTVPSLDGNHTTEGSLTTSQVDNSNSTHARPSFNASTVASTAPPSNMTSKTSVVQPTSPPNSSTRAKCDEDVCLRNMLDPNFSTSDSARSWCSDYMSSPANTIAVPTYLPACENNATRLNAVDEVFISRNTPAPTAEYEKPFPSSTHSFSQLQNHGYPFINVSTDPFPSFSIPPQRSESMNGARRPRDVRPLALAA